MDRSDIPLLMEAMDVNESGDLSYTELLDGMEMVFGRDSKFLTFVIFLRMQHILPYIFKQICDYYLVRI